MPDGGKKFHEFALQSILFKGRPDWYFCYLKAEKIAHVLLLLAERGEPSRREEVEGMARRAATIPGEVAHLAAGELDVAIVLADLFGLLSTIRTLAAEGALTTENALLLSHEYEGVAERLVRGSHPSPFVGSEQFGVPQLSEPQPLGEMRMFAERPTQSLKDKGHKGQSKGQSERMSLILELVRKRKSLSIKEIAAVIRDCSEKTIQRELNTLIERGLIRREGERRWSVYLPA